MIIEENIHLSDYTTLRLGGKARCFITLKKEEDISLALNFAKEKSLDIFLLGGGSNLVISDKDLKKLVLKMDLKGIKIIEDNNDVLVEALAGEIWDELVDFSVKNNFSGLEPLSLIPGTVGASPVQNIEAYGSDVSKVIKEVKGFNLLNNRFETLTNKECQFSYGDSIFKNGLKNKFIIVSVVFKLSREAPKIPNYFGVREMFEKNKSMNSQMTELELIRKTIIDIRNQKLPNPKEIANVGSFFKNVFIQKEKIDDLLKSFPAMPYFKEGDVFKIPTGYLIEQAGFKGQKFGEVGMYSKNALVLVNFGSEKASDILELAEKIKIGVKGMFGLNIEIEPEVVG